MTDIGTFAGIGLALYAAHHAGDYWVQTDRQAAKKGCAGHEGRLACLAHVATYTLTQAVFAIGTLLVTGTKVNPFALFAALLFSAVTHYAADRREFGIMFRLARMIPGKENFLRLGVPRADIRIDRMTDCSTCEGKGTSTDVETNGKCWDCYGEGKIFGDRVGDNPSLGTGGWALDQSWHIVLGVFVPALIACI
jgi:hypothetical protein